MRRHKKRLASGYYDELEREEARRFQEAVADEKPELQANVWFKPGPDQADQLLGRVLRFEAKPVLTEGEPDTVRLQGKGFMSFNVKVP